MIRRIVSLSRFTILIAVVFLLVGATALLIYGAVLAFELIRDTLTTREVSDHAARQLVVEMIELVDLLLFGTVLYVIAIGTYTLFISADIPLPAWLKIDDLDDLKDRLLGVVVVVLAVSFLGEVVAWEGSNNIQPLGIAVALVIAAIALFLMSHKRDHDGRSDVRQEGERRGAGLD
jgi:uncharacterized membrane protein YqhA